MGSTRLPGKVLMEIEGRPMLWHVVDRLKHSKKLNDIILAIPDTEKNDVLEKFCKDNKIKCFRGSEEDVLSRYYEAAKNFKCDVVVRITSDCPLIDPEVVDQVIGKHLSSGADFTANFLEGKKCESIERTFPRGLETEVFNFSILEKVHQQAVEQHQREHVDPYVFENPDIFKISVVKNDKNLSRLHLTVDEEKDLELVRKIYKKLYKDEANK